MPSIFHFDKIRYNSLVKSPAYMEPGMWLVCLFRFAQKIDNLRFKPFKIIISIFLIPIYKLFSIYLGISLPRRTKIGKGFVIFHYGAIAIHENSIIGENCTIRQGVTIGNKKSANDTPVLGNNVTVGAGAVIIGRIEIGDNVKIGANAVVLKDIPNNHIAVGIPAKNIPMQNI